MSGPSSLSLFLSSKIMINNFEPMFKKVVLPIILALVVVLGSAAGYYVWAKNNQVTIPFLEVEPKKAMDRMYEAMSGIKTMEYNSDIKLDMAVDLKKLSVDSKRRIAEGMLYVKDKQPRVLGTTNIKASTSTAVSTSSQGLGQVSAPESSALPGLGSPLSFLEKGSLDLGLEYGITGKLDQTDKEKVKTRNQMDISINVDNTSVGFDLETALNGRQGYYKLGKLPIPFSMLVSQLNSDLTGTWWRLDLAELEKKSEELASSSELDVSGLENLDARQEQMRKLRSRIRTMAAEHELLEVDKRLPDQTVNNRPCYHYQVSLNKDNLSPFVQDLYNTLSQELDDMEKPMIMSGFADDPDFKERVDKLAQAIKEAQAKVWIGKDKFYLYQADFQVAVDPSGIEWNGQEVEPDAITMEMSGQIKYDKINQPVKVTLPEKANDMNKFIEERLSKQQRRQRDAERYEDIRQIRYALEEFYQENQTYPQTIYGNDEFAQFLDKVPKNPKPEPGGTCLEIPNYDYTVERNSQFYRLKYCLENGYHDLGSGLHTAVSLDMSLNKLKQSKQDTDLDGLMDYEEIMTYQTDPQDDDTDGDGFEDGAEVESGYNPTGQGKLLNAQASSSEQVSRETPGSSAKQRDNTRLDNLLLLEDALHDYYADNDRYPETLDKLVDEYLEKIPQNPEVPQGNPCPAGLGYDYEPEKQDQGYVINKCLEVGVRGHKPGRTRVHQAPTKD